MVLVLFWDFAQRKAEGLKENNVNGPERNGESSSGSMREGEDIGGGKDRWTKEGNTG